MKKNVMMRVAAFLMVCVLASTCGISGTFAKYVTTNGGSDTARVAKWGVVIAIDDTIFSDSYKDIATTWTANEDLATITVQASTENTNVVAPGTNGSLAGFTVSGTPEVDVEVTYAATLTLSGWFIDADKDGTKDAGEEEYCPIVFTVGTKALKIGGDDLDGNPITTVAELELAVKNAIIAATATYHTNTNLSAVSDDLTVSWAWDFSTSDANDLKDTALGNQAIQDGDWASCVAATITLAVDMTITQIN